MQNVLKNLKTSDFLCSRAALDPIAGRVFETAAIHRKYDVIS